MILEAISRYFVPGLPIFPPLFFFFFFLPPFLLSVHWFSVDEIPAPSPLFGCSLPTRYNRLLFPLPSLFFSLISWAVLPGLANGCGNEILPLLLFFLAFFSRLFPLTSAAPLWRCGSGLESALPRRIIHRNPWPSLQFPPFRLNRCRLGRAGLCVFFGLSPPERRSL